MALYVIGDTHFSEGCDKPMDVFGGAWTGYRDKLGSSLAVLEPQDAPGSWEYDLQVRLQRMPRYASVYQNQLLLQRVPNVMWAVTALALS